MEKMSYEDKRFKRFIRKLRTSAEYCHAAVGARDKAYKLSEYVDLFRFSLIVLMALIALMSFLIEPVPVSGISMDPTLRDTERIFVEKVSFWFVEPKRGDIIICHYPTLESSVVKRVIALPGERIMIMDNYVYINGEPLDESAYWHGYMDSNMQEQTVPEGCVFVMGDNRNHSGDSRSVGSIPYNRIDGRAHAVVWPFDVFRWL